MMLRREEFDVLDELRKTGALPHQLEQRHQKLRREQLFKAGLKADHYPPPSTSRLENADMTVADWLKDKWQSADGSVRQALRALAEALGIPLPMVRTRQIPAVLVPNSTQARRSAITRHTSHAESDEIEETGSKERGYHDPPEWHDADADGWTPTESLHDALHPDEDRGWY